MKRLSLTLALILVFSLAFGLAANAQTIELRGSGYELEVSDYASPQSDESAAVGGNYFLFDYDSFIDLADGRYAEYEDAVNWWLTCGVTNGGTGWTTFGPDDPFYRCDLAFFLYRFYSISNDDGQWFYDDVPLNQMGAEVGYKFADATHAVRWSGLMDDYGDIFDPYGVVTPKTLLTTIFNVYTYEDGQLGEGAPLADGAATTMKVNINKSGDFRVVDAAEADGLLDGVLSDEADETTRIAVASLIANGIYEPDGELWLDEDLNRIEVIGMLYDCLRGTNATHTMQEAFMTVNDLTTVIEDDYASEGEEFTIDGSGEMDYAAGTNRLVVRNGAQVTLTDATIGSYNLSAAFGAYPLNYRWADGGVVVVYDPGTVLTLENPTLDFSSTIHMNGLEPTCGGTIIVKNADYQSSTQTLLCYNGTVIFEDCANMANGGRVHSSDFFSGVSVYKNCDVNYADGEFTGTVGGGFNDEASSTYIIDSNYGAGPGSMTGVSYFYMENSDILASTIANTNNTSMLTDVSSFVAVDSHLRFPDGILTIQKEGRILLRFIDCGVIELDPIESEPQDGASSEISGYDIAITGTEFGFSSSALIQLDGSEFSRPLDVYVAEGTSLIIQYTGDTAPVVNQDTSVTRDIPSYLNGKRTFEAVPNTGSVVLQHVEEFDF